MTPQANTVMLPIPSWCLPLAATRCSFLLILALICITMQIASAHTGELPM